MQLAYQAREITREAEVNKDFKAMCSSRWGFGQSVFTETDALMLLSGAKARVNEALPSCNGWIREGARLKKLKIVLGCVFVDVLCDKDMTVQWAMMSYDLQVLLFVCALSSDWVGFLLSVQTLFLAGIELPAQWSPLALSSMIKHGQYCWHAGFGSAQVAGTLTVGFATRPFVWRNF